MNEKISQEKANAYGYMSMEKFDLKDTVGLTASITTIIQFLAGLLICYKIWRQKTTGDISGFSFIAGTLSCSVWLKYGLLKADGTIIKVNFIGLCLELLYIVIYYAYSNNKPHFQNQVLTAFGVLFGLLGYIKYFVPDQTTATTHSGFIACGVGLVFFASPLSDLKTVLRTKSTELLPFPLIVAMFLVSTQWFLYGILVHDRFVQVPNFIAACISGFQLLLFAIYPNRPSTVAAY